MNCDKCLHSGICLYEEGARKFENDISTIEKPAFINTKVECEKFSFKYQNHVKKATPKNV